MDDFLNQTINFFYQRHILLKEEWITSAIEYLRSVNPEGSITPSFIYELWKYSDINESTKPCIPVDFNKIKDYNGALVLQIQSVLDIGTSYLSQFKKLVYVATDNAEFQNTDQNDDEKKDERDGSRLLQLILSDGVSVIKAVEYKRLPQFSIMVCPGSKLLLHGHIQVRRGVFLLIPENCQLLGGDVEELMKKNRPVEIMGAKLGISVPIQANILKNENIRPIATKSIIPPTVVSSSVEDNFSSNNNGPTVKKAHATENLQNFKDFHASDFCTENQQHKREFPVNISSTENQHQKNAVRNPRTEYQLNFNNSHHADNLCVENQQNYNDTPMVKSSLKVPDHNSSVTGCLSVVREELKKSSLEDNVNNTEKLTALLDKMTDVANKLDRLVDSASAFFSKFEK